MKLLKQSILILFCFILITGLIYPFLMTGIAQLAFPNQANGSLIQKNGKIIGSLLIGQNFTNDGYFHGRASSVDYQADNSGGYNFGPASSNFIAMVSNRIREIREKDGLSPLGAVPADMALASASGLDPDISVQNAMLQAKRIARSRRMDFKKIENLILTSEDKPILNLLGKEKVNVLRLNMALDKLSKEEKNNE